MQSDRREFPNEFAEYNGEQLVKGDGKVSTRYPTQLLKQTPYPVEYIRILLMISHF